MILQQLDLDIVTARALLQYDEGRDDLSPLLVGRADHGTLGDIGMAEQRRLEREARQAEAERERRAKVISAHGELEASEELRDAIAADPEADEQVVEDLESWLAQRPALVFVPVTGSVVGGGQALPPEPDADDTSGAMEKKKQEGYF